MQFPPEIDKLLQAEKFCFLATSFQDRPHLSLMNFTYLPERGIIVLSSRDDTTKMRHIEKNPAVALLLYDLGKEGGVPVSCTFFGTAALAAPQDEGYFRQKHYEKNKDMGVFINGPRIKMVAIKITNAVLADAKDKVTSWPGEKDLGSAGAPA